MKVYINFLLVIFTLNKAYAIQVGTLHYDKETIMRIAQNTSKISDVGFGVFLHHTKKVDAVMGINYAENKVTVIVLQEDSSVIAVNAKADSGLTKATIGNVVYYLPPSKDSKPTIPPDWQVFYEGIRTKYGEYYADRVTKGVSLNYYRIRGQKREYIHCLIAYFTAYPQDLMPKELNGFACDIFNNSNDKRQLKIALKWSNMALTDPSNTGWFNMDTNASLLYKLKRKKAAIKEETQALILAKPGEKQDIMQTIEKMRNNQPPTWKE
jgi:hypothetical protein